LESIVSVFLDKLNFCQLQKEGTAPWTQLTLRSHKCGWMNIADQIRKRYSLKSPHKIGNEQVMVREVSASVSTVNEFLWLFVMVVFDNSVRQTSNYWMWIHYVLFCKTLFQPCRVCFSFCSFCLVWHKKGMSEPHVFLCILQVYMYCICFRNVGHTMAEVVSFHSLTMKPRVPSQSVHVGFVVDIVALGQVYL